LYFNAQTGSNSGIGRAVALQLASKKATIILACRDMEKATQTAKDLIKKTGNTNIEAKYINLELLDSVRSFAASIKDCHILINNAGLLLQDKDSVDGMELTSLTNHLGPFLLTSLLRPVIERTCIKNNKKQKDVLSLSLPTSTVNPILPIFCLRAILATP
jgi:NAD(P)-dependent dehydrogenase (short-subunit alcohol dehydrogenase family)